MEDACAHIQNDHKAQVIACVSWRSSERQDAASSRYSNAPYCINVSEHSEVILNFFFFLQIFPVLHRGWW